MSIYKRGDIYWYKFMWEGRIIRESAKTGNDKTARKMEAAHRTRFAEGLVGIREKKRTTLAEFIKNRFEPWAKGRFENSASKTWKSWYEPSIRTLQISCSLQSHAYGNHERTCFRLRCAHPVQGFRRKGPCRPVQSTHACECCAACFTLRSNGENSKLCLKSNSFRASAIVSK
jgi:hypothetical protein